jgi:hypothetical protein
MFSKSLANKAYLPAPGTADNRSPSPGRIMNTDIDDRINLLTDQDSTENLAVTNLKNALDKIKRHASTEELAPE